MTYGAPPRRSPHHPAERGPDRGVVGASIQLAGFLLSADPSRSCPRVTGQDHALSVSPWVARPQLMPRRYPARIASGVSFLRPLHRQFRVNGIAFENVPLSTKTRLGPRERIPTRNIGFGLTPVCSTQNGEPSCATLVEKVA